MSATPTIEQDNYRLATLLCALGDEAIEPSLAKLDHQRASEIRKLIKQLNDQPPDHDDLNLVLDDFQKFLRFALETVGASSALSSIESAALADLPDESSPTADAGPQLKIFQPSDDPIADLQRLDPIQIAGALDGEHPKTIAMILASMDQAAAAKTIDLLPEETQSETFMLLRQGQQPAEDLIVRVARATVEKGAKIEVTEIDESDSEQKTADFLRQLPKSTRSRLLEQLKESDSDAAARLQELLYRFEDLLQYDNRSIQKLLGQVETNVLVVALEDVDDEIKQRVFDNLSKRAVSALNEEMEFKQKSSPEEIDDARQQIAKLIGQLDQDGELVQLN